MTNKQYVEKIITSVDRILVDTSTLMTHGFQQFIGNNKERLISGGKSIIVPKSVYTEIARLLDSEEPEKSAAAMSAVELLALNKNIFQVESAPLTEEEIAHAFADAQLLSELTLHKSDYNQLLITNDRKLSCDAFELNQQQSCKGRRILVCYINWCGELQCCECARPASEKKDEHTMPSSEEPVQAIAVSEDAPINLTEQEEAPWIFDWKSGLIGISGIGILFGLLKLAGLFFTPQSK